ncbi:MAG: hypothetical protein AAF993_05710 [Pseudomonadota bacterium]
MRRLLTQTGSKRLLIVALSLSLLSSPAVAQQASTPADSTSDTPTEQRDSADKGRDGESRSSDKGDDIFRPSEEISEDFAVSFPVDI